MGEVTLAMTFASNICMSLGNESDLQLLRSKSNLCSMNKDEDNYDGLSKATIYKTLYE